MLADIMSRIGSPFYNSQWPHLVDEHKLTNQRKRTIPASSAKIKILTFADLDALQVETDARDVPQGEHLTANQRKKLLNFKIGSQTISEGDHVAVTGFVAPDRDVRCGGAESVNCGHKNTSAESKTALALARIFTCPLCRNPMAFRFSRSSRSHSARAERQDLAAASVHETQGRQAANPRPRGLFYDSFHIVNTHQTGGGSQPKRLHCGRFIRSPPCWSAR
jgi:hypothetical protein